MDVRVGFVGVGKWAKKMAPGIIQAGGEIVGHVRQGTEPAGGMGKLFPDWLRLLTQVDALVVTGPPLITNQITRACIESGNPVLATKPILLHQIPQLKAPCSVDTARLWSRCFNKLLERCTASGPLSLSFNFFAPGPDRTASGMDVNGIFDYGPHVFALLNELYDTSFKRGFPFLSISEAHCKNGFIYITGGLGKVPVTLRFGCRAAFGRRQLLVETIDGHELAYEEGPEVAEYLVDGILIDTESRGDCIALMCEDFLARVRRWLTDPTGERWESRSLALAAAGTDSLLEVARYTNTLIGQMQPAFTVWGGPCV